MEKTLIIFKPDCMEKACAGEVLRRFEETGFKICACKMIGLSEALLNEHYGHIAQLPFFPEIIEFMRSTPVIVMVLQGEDIIRRVRDLVGPTDSAIAPKGTIRGDMGTDKMRNIVHASDSAESSAIEIRRFFAEDEVFSA